MCPSTITFSPFASWRTAFNPCNSQMGALSHFKICSHPPLPQQILLSCTEYCLHPSWVRPDSTSGMMAYLALLLQYHIMYYALPRVHLKTTCRIWSSIYGQMWDHRGCHWWLYSTCNIKTIHIGTFCYLCTQYYLILGRWSISHWIFIICQLHHRIHVFLSIRKYLSHWYKEFLEFCLS